MPKQLARRYQLSKKQKEIIAAYLHDEITGIEAADAFKMTRQNFKGMVASIFQDLVRGGDLEITKSLSTY